MKINERKIAKIFQKLKKSELVEFLNISFKVMDDKQKRDVFLELYNGTVNKNITPEKLYSNILAFNKKSVNGDYYAPFDINSKNFMDIPNETDEWFSEVSYYLDETTNLVEKGEYKMANQCFEKLFDTIEEMSNGLVVFADEYGTWMLVTKTDFENAYIKSLSQTEDADKFADKVLPLLIRDSHESFYGKIYSKIKKAANPEQLRKIQEEIKLKGIAIN